MKHLVKSVGKTIEKAGRTVRDTVDELNLKQATESYLSVSEGIRISARAVLNNIPQAKRAGNAYQNLNTIYQKIEGVHNLIVLRRNDGSASRTRAIQDCDKYLDQQKQNRDAFNQAFDLFINPASAPKPSFV